MSLHDEVKGFKPEDDLDKYNEERTQKERAAAEAEAQAQREADEAERELQARREQEEREAQELEKERQRDALIAFLTGRRGLIGQIDETSKSIVKVIEDQAEAGWLLHDILNGATNYLSERTFAALGGTEGEAVSPETTDDPMDLSNAELIISRKQADLEEAQAEIERLNAANRGLSHYNSNLKAQVTEFRRRHGALEDGWDCSQANSGSEESVAPSDEPEEEPHKPTRRMEVDTPEPDTTASGETDADDPQDVGLDITRPASEQTEEAAASGDTKDDSNSRSTQSKLNAADQKTAKRLFDGIVVAVTSQHTKRGSTTVIGQEKLVNDLHFGCTKLAKSVEQYDKELANRICEIRDELKSKAKQPWTTRSSKTIEDIGELDDAVAKARQELNLID